MKRTEGYKVFNNCNKNVWLWGMWYEIVMSNINTVNTTETSHWNRIYYSDILKMTNQISISIVFSLVPHGLISKFQVIFNIKQ